MKRVTGRARPIKAKYVSQFISIFGPPKQPLSLLLYDTDFRLYAVLQFAFLLIVLPIRSQFCILLVHYV